MENYRPGLMTRLGLDPADLRRANPRLVTLSITGFGAGGPDGMRPGFDQIVQAEAGLMSLTGSPDGDPTRVGLPIADLLAGMFGAFGVMTALAERERTGLGRAVETSLLPPSPPCTRSTAPAGSALVSSRCARATGIPRSRRTARSGAPTRRWSSPSGRSRCGVGSRRWRASTPTARTSRPTGCGWRGWTTCEAGGRAACWPDSKADDVIAELAPAGVPAGRIRTVPEVYDWEQVRGLGLLHTMTHPVLGDVTVPGGAVRYDGAMAASPRAASAAR